MSEICLKCLNKTTGEKYTEKSFVLSKDLDLCEECGEWKRVVVVRRNVYYRNIICIVLFPLTIIVKLLMSLYKFVKFAMKHIKTSLTKK